LALPIIAGSDQTTAIKTTNSTKHKQNKTKEKQKNKTKKQKIYETTTTEQTTEK
jgi:hypothetical protein